MIARVLVHKHKGRSFTHRFVVEIYTIVGLDVGHGSLLKKVLLHPSVEGPPQPPLYPG